MKSLSFDHISQFAIVKQCHLLKNQSKQLIGIQPKRNGKKTQNKTETIFFW